MASRSQSEYVWGGELIRNPRRKSVSDPHRFWQRYMAITAPRSFGRMYWSFKDWLDGPDAPQQGLGGCWYEAAGRERYVGYSIWPHMNETFDSQTVWL